MGIADRLKDAAKKAEETAAEHKDQIREAVHKAQDVADQRTGGKYSEQLQKAAAKADGVVDRLKDPDQPPADAAPVPAPDAPAHGDEGGSPPAAG